MQLRALSFFLSLFIYLFIYLFLTFYLFTFFLFFISTSFRASRDARLPPSCCTLFQATKELMQVTDVLHTELAADASVMFLRRSFVLLTKRAKDCSLGIKKGLFGGGKLAANMG